MKIFFSTNRFFFILSFSFTLARRIIRITITGQLYHDRINSVHQEETLYSSIATCKLLSVPRTSTFPIQVFVFDSSLVNRTSVENSKPRFLLSLKSFGVLHARKTKRKKEGKSYEETKTEQTTKPNFEIFEKRKKKREGRKRILHVKFKHARCFQSHRG